MVAPSKEDGDDGPVEVPQHKLIDVEYQMHDVSLYLSNLDKEIPLRNGAKHPRWPYTELEVHIDQEDGLLDFTFWGRADYAAQYRTGRPSPSRMHRELRPDPHHPEPPSSLLPP